MTRVPSVVAVVVALQLAGPADARASGGSSVAASPLAANGLSSPSCTSAALSAQLSASERTNCAVSGVAVAPVPLSNYAIDVDIPSGLGASFAQDGDSIVQELLLTPVWTALVWLVHVVLVALEWCYSLDLLAPATLGRATAALAGAKRVFTDPWLGLALAVAAIGFAWQGLVRRQVLDTLGRAALMALMITAGLWVMADPAGTVGAVGGMADRAALATVAASATGDPDQPVSTVDAALGSVFDAAITGPWCYLEFGAVDWCRDPSALDPRLRAAADQLEQVYRAGATCRGPSPGLVRCAPDGSALQQELSGAETALADARTNGALFLAVPAGATPRTALTGTPPTLFGTLCGSTNASACTAPTAPQAEFRSASGTWPRVGGLVLIVAGSLGMLLLLGFIAMRLLGAALATLLYLLIAPLAVLAPALGDSGRATFRLWLVRLVGALLSKLVYSVALGVVLLVATLLDSLDGLGWWTQWLLVSVFWWTAFEHRHRILGLVIHERGEPTHRPPLSNRLWRASRTVGAGAAIWWATRDAVMRSGAAAIDVVRRGRDLPEAPLAAPPGRDLTRRMRARDELRAQVDRVATIERPRADPSARAARLDAALMQARAQGDRRRELSLLARRERVRAEQAPPARRLERMLPSVAQRALEVRERRRALDRAATRRIPRSDAELAPLAGLAGLSSSEYRERPQSARIEVERELDRRRSLLAEAESAPRRVVRAALDRAPLTARQRQFDRRMR
ncbi:MAG: hypothetical protein ACRDLP_05675 [Solirubrobacteraceae bacterium]